MLSTIRTHAARLAYGVHSFLFGRKATEKTCLALRAFARGNIGACALHICEADQAIVECIAGDIKSVLRDAAALLSRLNNWAD